MGIGDETARLAHDAFQAALHDIAETVRQKAADNVGVGDPAVDPNPAIALAESGHIEQHGDGLVVIFDTEYAARQHEDIHAKHPRGGHAKYLERAVTEVVPTMDRVIASKVDVRLSAGLPRESR